MSFGVLAYPQIQDLDFERIQKFRKENDALYYEVVNPHFAFVFPTEIMGKKEFIEEISQKAQGFGSINFEIRSATVNKDAFLDYFHTLLVPDQGYSDVVKLHDRLYSGKLFEELRLDIDFIPHMGIANSKDRYEVKKWTDSWNDRDFMIKGNIDELTIVDYDGENLRDICRVGLG